MVAMQKPDGTYITDRQKVEDLVRSSWATVYAGNVANPMQATARYLHKHAAYIFKASPFKLAELDPDELHQVVLSCSPSAAGLDSWTYDDWKWLPREAFVQLCMLLTLVENGHQWPAQLLNATAHMLSKDPDDPFNPLAYRLLLITPILYRAWAKL